MWSVNIIDLLESEGDDIMFWQIKWERTDDAPIIHLANITLEK